MCGDRILRKARAGKGWLARRSGEAKKEFDQVNARSFEYNARKREADADKNLYEELERKIKEAGITAGFQSGAIRIADPARPAFKPVFPNVQLNVLLAFLFSGLLAVGGDRADRTFSIRPSAIPSRCRARWAPR